MVRGQLQCAALVRHGMLLSSCPERCTCRADSVQPCPWRPSVSRPNSDVHFSSRRVETLSSRLNLFSRTFPSGPVVFYVCEDELSSLSVLYRSGAILPQKQLSDPLILLFRLQRQRLVFSRLLFVFFFIFTSAFDPQLPLLNTASPIFLRLPAVARHLSCHPSPLSSVSTSLPVPTPLSPFIAHFLSKRRCRRSSFTACSDTA